LASTPENNNTEIPTTKNIMEITHAVVKSSDGSCDMLSDIPITTLLQKVILPAMPVPRIIALKPL
jgi:hypothetical protein